MEPRLYRHSPTVGPIVPSTLGEVLVMVALWNRAYHYIFILWFPSIFYLILFSSPNISGRTLDVYHTSTHGVVLVRI